MNDKLVVPSERMMRNKIEDRSTRASIAPKTYKIQRPRLLLNEIEGQFPLAADGGKQRPVN